MRKCKLIAYHTEHKSYKDDYYMRATLMFQIIVFGVYKYQKNITYDVTMFEDFKSFKDDWSNMINQKIDVPYSLIKDNKIF